MSSYLVDSDENGLHTRLEGEAAKKEGMNDGVGQCDSVHHASLSTEALLCQRVRGREGKNSREDRDI